ncbi:MAG: metalloprotease PmbA [Gammaproteobacteria bacterium]|nr:metalloprotease PmbA [Gammaproteobacteria bacterium]
MTNATNIDKARSVNLNADNYKNIIDDLLKESKAMGASSAEAGLSVGSGLSTTVRMGKVETIEHNQDKGLSITVYFDHKKGSASTTDLSPQACKDAVAAACRVAKYTAEDDCSGLADKTLLAKNIPDLDLYFNWDLHIDDAISLAQECEEAALSFDPKIKNSEGGSLSTQQGLRIYGNTDNFIEAYPTTRHSLSCSVIAQENDQMQRDYWYSVARDSNDLEPSKNIGIIAAENAINRLNARKIPTCQSPVIFKSHLASGIFSSFISAISGGSLYRKTSFLLDSLDEQVFPKNIHIYEQPHIKKGLGSAPFDGEGVATQQRDIVLDGTVKSYILSSYSARKLGMTSTGNAGGVHNLKIDTSNLSLDDMIKKMGKGLLVTELMGQGINRVTGHYSRGATGFWIENGEIQFPVEEITIAGNLKEMYQGIVDIGNDIDLRQNIQTGSILIDNITIAGE